MSETRKLKSSGGSGVKRKAKSTQHTQQGSTDRKVTPTYAEQDTNRKGMTDAQRAVRMELERRLRSRQARTQAAETKSKIGVSSQGMTDKTTLNTNTRIAVAPRRAKASRIAGEEETRRRQSLIRARA